MRHAGVVEADRYLVMQAVQLQGYPCFRVDNLFTVLPQPAERAQKWPECRCRCPRLIEHINEPGRDSDKQNCLYELHREDIDVLVREKALFGNCLHHCLDQFQV